MFVGLGTSGVVPMLHGLQMDGFQALDDRMGLRWILLQGGLYIFGAFLYAVSTLAFSLTLADGRLTCSEGPMARAYKSWIVRYLGQLPPDLPHLRAACGGIAPLWYGEGVRPSSQYHGSHLLKRLGGFSCLLQRSYSVLLVVE